MANIKLLPDAYYKETDGNNYKLLNLNEQLIGDLKTDADAVLNALNINQVTGHTLNLYGNMVGVPRKHMTDTQYRTAILTKIAANLFDGTPNAMLDVLSKIFMCDKKDIILDDSTYEVVVGRLPFDALQEQGIPYNEAMYVIEELCPLGIGVSWANVEGTFEFGGASDYDESAGFGNIAQTVGGYFGLIEATTTEV